MKTSHLLLASALLGLTTIAYAQPEDGDKGPGPGGPGGRDHRGPRGGRSPIVRVLDADKDGTISAAEIAAAPTALKTLDKNNDGKITVDELKPTPPADAPADAPKPPANAGKRAQHDPLFAALDTDSNGELSAAEIAAAPTSLKKLDKNADGQLTREEIRPTPPPRE